MTDLLRVANALCLSSPRQIQRMCLVALAMEMCRKLCAAKRGFLKAEGRLLSLGVTGLTEVRRLVVRAIGWLGSKDKNTANQLDQLVIVYGINSFLKLSAFLLEIAIGLLKRKHLLLKSVQDLANLEHLLKQCVLDLEELVVIAHSDKAFGNGRDA